MPIDRSHGSTWQPMSRRRMLQTSAFALGAAGLIGCSSDGDAAPTTADESEASQLGLQKDALIVGSLAKPTVAFTDTNNQPFDFAAETDGRLTLLFFGYTSCPNQCPVYLNNVAATLKKVEGPAMATKVVFVGVDTARDTPEKMKEYLGAKNPNFIGLTATPEDIDAALAGLLLPSVAIPEDTTGNYVVGHPLQAAVFTPDNLCHVMYPYDIRQSEWAEELTKLADFDWSRLQD